MASEDHQEILNKISQLAGQINRHKNGQAPEQQEQPQSIYGGMQPDAPSSEPDADQGEGYPQSSTGWRGAGRGSRGSRGSRGFVRGGRHNHVHRNKSLVLNASHTAAPSTIENDIPSINAATANWVSKNDRGHRQLINPAVYEKEKGPRIRSMEELRLQRLKRRDQFERAKLERHVKAEETRQVLVDGGLFRVSKKGQKLQRISGERLFTRKLGDKLDLVNQADLHCIGAPTPKIGFVAGVKFYRSKNGNMYRDASIKIHGKAKKTTKPCKAFTITGIPFLLRLSSFALSGGATRVSADIIF
ncbi:hypothetical protein ACEPPN_003224 [Leptodophora sp. 'Broadleaf-Isolate-01']